MSDTDLPAPRRALGLPEDSPEEAAPAEHRPSRAIWATIEGEDVDPDSPLADNERTDDPSTETLLADDQAPAATTPVPPPAPVLPTPPSFELSGSESSEDTGYVPRRSAVSVSSPADDLDMFGSVQDPTPPAPPTADAERRTFWQDPRQRLMALGVVGVAVIALIVGLVAAALARPAPGTAASTTPVASASSPAPKPLEAALITPEDLAAADPNTTWIVGDTASSPDAQGAPALCLSGPLDPPASEQLTRRVTTSVGTDGLVQVLGNFADTDAAKATFAAMSAQLGNCTNVGALVTGGFAVSGLADESAGVTVRLQETAAITHTLLLTRTGTSVSLLDLAQAKSTITPGKLAQAASGSLKRECDLVAGTCPGDVKATPAVPPAGGVIGWLTESDLPRVTVGAGRWGATAPAPPNLVGSQCEGIDLNQVSGASTLAHRTYLLADDGAAPAGFGVDEAVYTFGKAGQATTLAKKLTTSINGCRGRTKTATVKKLATVNSVGASGAKLSATSYAITQRISATKSVRFRVAVAAVGRRVVYLLANPSSKFDFSDAQWAAIAARAMQRSTQFA